MIITGGLDDKPIYREEIYKLDTEDNSWVELGNMKTARAWHGLSVIDYNDVSDYCTAV